jgi:hypothetical protein
MVVWINEELKAKLSLAFLYHNASTPAEIRITAPTTEYFDRKRRSRFARHIFATMEKDNPLLRSNSLIHGYPPIRMTDKTAPRKLPRRVMIITTDDKLPDFS